MNRVGQKVSAYERQADDWYVEPGWTVDLLLSAIRFHGSIWDPACGMGTIPKACERAGYDQVSATDLVDRGYGAGGQDFLKFNRKWVQPADNIITNPPYSHSEAFMRQSLNFARDKAAFLVPMKFLNSNTRFRLFTALPVWRVCVLSSRPSMPPGRYLDKDTGHFSCDDPHPRIDPETGDVQLRWKAGDTPSGGAIDYCWIVLKQGYEGTAGVIWLKRADARAKPSFSKRAHRAAPEAAQSRQGGAA